MNFSYMCYLLMFFLIGVALSETNGSSVPTSEPQWISDFLNLLRVNARGILIAALVLNFCIICINMYCMTRTEEEEARYKGYRKNVIIGVIFNAVIVALLLFLPA